MFLTCCYLLLCLVTGSLHLSIMKIDATAPPTTDVQSVLGETVTLYCECQPSDTTDYTIKWWRWLDINATQVQIYQRLGTRAPQLLNVEKNIGMGEKDSIVINEAQPRDSGMYLCALEDIKINDKDCDKITLRVYTPGSMPKIVVKPESEDQLSVECSAHEVYPEPALVIHMIDRNTEKLLLNNESTPEKEGNYTWNVSTNATVSVESAEGATFTCELFFVDEKISHTPYIAEYKYHTTGTIKDDFYDEIDTDLLPEDIHIEDYDYDAF